MSPDLPASIAAYFAAERGDSDAVARCFTDQAVVTDEGHTFTGRAAIKQWKADTSTRYTYTSTPIAIEEKNGKTVVTSHLAGDFPGSPTDLRYFFSIEGDKIAALEIIP